MAKVGEQAPVAGAAGSHAVARAGAAPRKLVLVGFMCAGKSRGGRRLAARTGRSFVDADKLLEKRLGEPISSFFEREGEPAFREREEALVKELLAAPEPGIVALGGGAVESAAVRAALRDATVVHVDVDAATAWSRAEGTDRPLARDRGRFERLHASRLPLYESVADLKLAWADVGEGYPVYVGAGALAAAGTLWPHGGGRAFLVADEAADAAHGEALREALAQGVELGTSIGLPPGERSKTLAEAERVLRALAAAGMQRSDAIVALGGGVAGDLAGFCAATYQRGVAIVHFPTTLVAQVDSAYGGKTGVDLPEGKNYVGAFHQPAAVVTDPDTLRTLPPAELVAGFAEVVKTALLAGGALWDDLRGMPAIGTALAGDPALAGRVIFRCVRKKLDVVAADEREHGERAALNLGHTFAHALESATGYARYRHGEAVAIGLRFALRLSERFAGLDPAVGAEVHEILDRHGLPAVFDGPSTEVLMEHIGRDKKRRGERRNLVLLRVRGRVELGAEVPDAALARAIDELRDGGGVRGAAA